jgi:hypothetical protein
VASKNASTFENNDVGRNVPLDVLLKAMFASEAQVVFEYFRRGALSQIVYHSVPLSSHRKISRAAQHALDLAAVLGPLLDFVIIALVGQQRVVGFLRWAGRSFRDRSGGSSRVLLEELAS